MYCGDEVAALVGDIGSSVSKFGYAGEDTPRHICTSNVGATSGNAFFVGDEAAGYPRANQVIRNPICNWNDVKSSKNSEIKDWDVVQNIWENVMRKAKLTGRRDRTPRHAGGTHVESQLQTCQILTNDV